MKIQTSLSSCFQVMEAVHGVTIEEVNTALQRSDWNPVRAEQQLKVRKSLKHHRKRHSACLFMLQWIVLEFQNCETLKQLMQVICIKTFKASRHKLKKYKSLYDI